jgi:hypothetical protein
VQVFRDSLRYQALYNLQLYNSNQRGWQISTRYLADPSGVDGSAFEVGVRHSDNDYPWRLPQQVAQLDNAYTDNEWFADVRWDVSPITLLVARVGLLSREYANLGSRNTHLLTLDAQAMYDLTPQILVYARLWRRPFSDDFEPDVFYSIQNGGSVSLFWRITPKTMAGVFYQQTIQHDYLGASGAPDGDPLHLPGYGVRFQWQARDNMRWILDLVSQRQQGNNTYDDYNQRFIRIGFEYWFGSHGANSAHRLLTPDVCSREHPALLMCTDQDPRIEALQ